MSTAQRAAAGPLRVLQVVGNSVIGGAENHVLTLVRALDPARYQVAVVCPRAGPLVDALQAAGVPVHLIEMVKPAPDDEYELSLPPLSALFALMRRWRPDIVHSHLYPAHLHATLAGELAGPRGLVTTAHTLVVRPGDAWLARLTSGRVIAVSRAAKARLVETGVSARRIRVIYNGIEPHYFADETASAQRIRQQLGIAAEAPVVGIIARLSPEKGHEAFLSIARDVATRWGDSRFLIVGTGPMAAALEAQTAALGLGKRVIFTGARRDVTALNHVIDLFLLPSREEALPLAVLEAMAARRPVVASAVGGVPEVVRDGETGFLVSPDDHDGFVRAVETLLAQPGLRARLGLAGQHRVRRRFGVNQMIRETLRFYRAILDGETRRGQRREPG
jgi:glycosyltransferase involved in cell wall biosynthesis